MPYSAIFTNFCTFINNSFYCIFYFLKAKFNCSNSIFNKGALIFTGSKKIEGTYLAELSGSMVAVYADEEAIVNSSHHDSNNDDVWIANEKEMPALELPVVIRFLLPKSD